MDILEMAWKIVESQGVIALILLISMWQQSMMNGKLLQKNCELNRFIMKCLEKELDEDHIPSNVSQPSQNGQIRHNVMAQGIVGPSDTKIEI